MADLTIHLTPDEALSLVAGPIVEGRDVSYAESAAYSKVWAAYRNLDVIRRLDYRGIMCVDENAPAAQERPGADTEGSAFDAS